MYVDKTSGVSHNPIRKIVRNQNLVKPEETKKPLSGVSNDAKTLRERDKVEVSLEAKEINKILSGLKEEIKQMPDTSEEKIKIAKTRIESGVYDIDAVKKEVARSIKNSGLI